MTSLGTPIDPPARRWGRALARWWSGFRPQRTKAVICAPSSAFGDRPLVVHAAGPHGPAGWPDELAPERDEVRRPSTYVVWLDDAGCLHSALRIGHSDARSSLVALRYVLEHPIDEVFGVAGPVRAMRWHLGRRALPLFPVVDEAGAGEQGLTGTSLHEVARRDVALRQQLDTRSARSWGQKLLLSGSWLLAVVGARLLEPSFGDAAHWGTALVLGLVVALVLLDDRRRRNLALRSAHAFRVEAEGDVELTATWHGISVGMTGAEGPS